MQGMLTQAERRVTVTQARPQTMLPRVDSFVHWMKRRADIDPVAVKRGMVIIGILRDLGMNEPGCLAALMHCVCGAELPEDPTLFDGWEPEVVEEVRQLYFGVVELARLSSFIRHSDDNADPEANEENLRKMLITMVGDVRVVLIKLVQQLQWLQEARTGNAAAEEKRALSRLTFDIYAPLANRLGIWQLKWEMEDLAFRFSNPAAYHQLAERLNEKREDREEYIQTLIAVLCDALANMGVEAEVRGRPKHLYSIWKKMQRKGLAFENLWDVRAVRIIVDSVSDCYVVLGIVHTQWRHLPGEFDDYIATPKPNGYRSIHTVVIGPDGRSVEVQIRTREMHQENELGVAAHWRYKENRLQEDNIDLKVIRLRQLLEWKQELEESESVVGILQEAAENRRIYVFTPKGAVIDLPTGATPVDFAYAIHSEVGHSIRGARVNSRMVPLNHHLETADQVEILTQKNASPSRDWLRPELGIVQTQRARSRIRQWFKQKDHAQHMAEGRNLLDKELSRLGLEDLGYDRITSHTPFHRSEDLLAALGAGDYKLSRALLPFRRELERQANVGLAPRPRPALRAPESFRVNGVGNLLTAMAKCCQPVPGEPIIGYISHQRGVVVHHRDCSNIDHLPGNRRTRLIDVEWGQVETNAYPVSVKVTAYHRTGILHDVSQVLKDEQIDVLKVNTDTDEENVIRIMLQMEVNDIKILSKTLGRLSKVQNVLDVRRLRH